MDTLIKLLRIRGYKIFMRNHETYTMIEGEEVQMTLREKVKRVMVPSGHGWQTADYSLTNTLIFKVRISYHEVEWKDDKLPIEKKLAKILAKMESWALQRKEERLIREKRWREEEELEKLRRAYQEKKRERIGHV